MLYCSKIWTNFYFTTLILTLRYNLVLDEVMKLTYRNEHLHFPVKSCVWQFQESSRKAEDASGINNKLTILKKVYLFNLWNKLHSALQWNCFYSFSNFVFVTYWVFSWPSTFQENSFLLERVETLRRQLEEEKRKCNSQYMN